MIDIGSFFFQIFDRLISLKDYLFEFLFYEVDLGLTSFTVWQLLAGGGIFVFLTAVIIKCFI